MNESCIAESDDPKRTGRAGIGYCRVNQLLQDGIRILGVEPGFPENFAAGRSCTQLAADRLDAVRISAVLGRQAIN